MVSEVPLTTGQDFEAFLVSIQEPGTTVTFARDKDSGRYVSRYTQQCWQVWEQARLPLTASEKRAEAALDVAIRYGGIDGAHHKTWVIDQVVRALTGDKYDAVIADANDGEDGPDTYEWDTGIAP